MTTFHITAKGDPGVCKASVRSCPLGGESEHYSSAGEARKAFETTQGRTLPPARKTRRTFPEPLNNARKIAEEAAGRKLPVDRVWIEKPVAGAYGEYQVRYTEPGQASGSFIANLPLHLEREDFQAYEAWKERQ